MGSKKCFVCGSTLSGKSFNLSNYKLKHSKTEIIQKIGLMVGDRFVVICKSDDVICQSCAVLMETVDKAEHERNVAKRLIYNFLEKKYSLNSDEFPNETEVKPETSFAAGKRKSMEALGELAQEVGEEGRRSLLMSCDTCHYTTGYSTFVKRHVRTVKKRVCSHCSGPLEDGQCISNCDAQNPPEEPKETFLGNTLDQSYLEGEDMPIEEQISLSEAQEDEDDGPEGKKQAVYFHVLEGNGKEGKGVREVLTAIDSGAMDGIRIMWDREVEKQDALLE